jgi:hypothetical protein
LSYPKISAANREQLEKCKKILEQES